MIHVQKPRTQYLKLFINIQSNRWQHVHVHTLLPAHSLHLSSPQDLHTTTLIHCTSVHLKTCTHIHTFTAPQFTSRPPHSYTHSLHLSSPQELHTITHIHVSTYRLHFILYNISNKHIYWKNYIFQIPHSGSPPIQHFYFFITTKT
jgi:hypothetical protein